MKAIFYDGRVDGAAAAAKALVRLIPPEEGRVRSRDASVWAPGDDIEAFDAVAIPAAPDFDALAEAYAAAGAEVTRLATDDEPQAAGKPARKPRGSTPSTTEA